MRTVLWLDDWRDPFKNPEWVKMFSPIPFPDKVEWVKSYDEFVNYLNNNELPDVVCFDHDLGEEKTGYDCAKYLVEFVINNKLELPLYGVQSANPVGKTNIICYLNSYLNFKWNTN